MELIILKWFFQLDLTVVQAVTRAVKMQLLRYFMISFTRVTITKEIFTLCLSIFLLHIRTLQRLLISSFLRGTKHSNTGWHLYQQLVLNVYYIESSTHVATIHTSEKQTSDKMPHTPNWRADRSSRMRKITVICRTELQISAFKGYFYKERGKSTTLFQKEIQCFP